jgi:hypothetical protein
MKVLRNYIIVEQRRRVCIPCRMDESRIRSFFMANDLPHAILNSALDQSTVLVAMVR